MIDLPTRARVLAGGKRLWVRALQRADHGADALSFGGADAGVAPTSTNGRSLPRVAVALSVQPIVELTPRQALRLAEAVRRHQ